LDQISLPDTVHSGDNSVWSLHLQQRMNRRVNWDREGFAVLAQVEVGTARVHAHVTNATNDPLARIARRIMSNCVGQSIAHQEVARLAESHKVMIGMLLFSNLEAGSACVEIWTINTFEAITDYRRVAQVASREMTNRLYYVGNRSSGARPAIRWSTSGRGSGALSPSAKDRMNKYPSGRFNVEEFMERIVLLRGTRLNTGSA